MFAFKSEAAAFEAVTALFNEGHNPSILEFLDRQSVSCAEHYTGKPVFADCPCSALLLIEVDGSHSEVSTQRKGLLRLVCISS